ncbi:MAG TPA: site-specific integrase [Streptosporangiaceae bacterium]|nr:site-specific integrase [Streptosporangiaceae bacterium]
MKPEPTLTDYLARWLADVVRPNLEPATFAYYEAMVRLYITPCLGSKRLDRLETHDVQDWLDTLPALCQCCIQGKDAARPARKRRCCAVGNCCRYGTGRRTIEAARNTLRTALSRAIASGELTGRNVAGLAKLPSHARARHHLKDSTWSMDEASRFLTSAQDDEDPLYAAYVLVLVNALHKGEVLGLTWPSIDLDRAEFNASWQLQRVGAALIHKERAKTNDAHGTLPLPDISVTALKLRRAGQDAARELAADHWQASDLVFTTRWGTPVEPRNFNRSFDTRCAKAGVPRIRVEGARQLCAPILADLAVHPSVAARIIRHAKIAGAARQLNQLRPGAESSAAQPASPPTPYTSEA